MNDMIQLVWTVDGASVTFHYHSAFMFLSGLLCCLCFKKNKNYNTCILQKVMLF
jgi:hypothetical protein